MSWKKFASLAALSLVAACAAGPMAPVQQSGADVSDWPAHRSPTRLDPAMETRIANIVAGMTLEQKIGQITQPDVRWITPDEVAQYYIGSVLNGGGAWPNNNKRATVQDWASQSAAYHAAAMR
ncbi:MAG: glycoside hydrolase family 3 protein, partial [Brevundimonas sp.]